MRKKPSHIKIVHGDEDAKAALAGKYKEVLGSEVKIEVGR
jgi:metallo-beta-lactamase family protein